MLFDSSHVHPYREPDATRWRIPMPPSGGPIGSKPIPANILAETRARAYELAKAELPTTANRAAVMAAADEIFTYLMYGLKPSE
ncbi:hypothetical protein [Methylobacterium sp. P1-11]|uniref:hypothetical protein n=1 Tax=Methylobacterium sp. P1-11 TaxID=2024616 RepID=UPI0011EE0A0D|nr:hypothetical protein [Methylobacterium sp. P1-11]